MPDNPNTWLRMPPELMGVILAMAIGLVRVIYDRKETRPIRVIMESLICGGLSLTSTSAIIALDLDSNWAIFAGGAIGYFGSTTIRAIAVRLIEKRM